MIEYYRKLNINKPWAHLLETKHINVGLYSEKHAARTVWYAVQIVKVAYLSVYR